MRNLFLALVLANLGFAAWHAWFARATVPASTVREDLPGITLIRELADFVEFRDDASTPPAESFAAPDGQSPENRCVSIGPFRDLHQAAAVEADLRGAGYDPVQHVAEGDVWVGYWVYIEAIPSRRDANEILSTLRETGIADSYVIPDSDSGSLVSLGVFSDLDRAESRRREVRALGHEATVAGRTRRATVYWVDVALRADQTSDLDALPAAAPGVRVGRRSCDPPAP